MANYIGKLKDGREVFQNYLPLNEQIQDFHSLGIQHLASPDDIALIRIEGLSNEFSRTSMMPIRAKQKPTILTRLSELMSPLMAEVIMDAHRQGNYPDIFPDSSYDILEEKANTQSSLAPEDRDIHILEGKVDTQGKFFLTLEMDDTKFILRRNASAYFEGRHTQIPFYDLPDIARKGRTVANYVCFGESQSGSELGARYGDLYCDGRAFGVRDKIGAAMQLNLGDNLTRIENASNDAIEQTAREMEIAGLLKFGFSKKASATLLEILRKSK